MKNAEAGKIHGKDLLASITVKYCENFLGVGYE
jgi:hypothetical protein